MSISESVWERQGYGATGQMSKHLFAFMLTFWTAIGIGSSAFVAYHSQHVVLNLWYALGVLAVSFLGIFIALRSDTPIVSLIGYLMVTIPFGFLTGPAVAMYTTASIVKVLMITTAIVVVLGIVGAIIPQSLESWGSFLFGGLLILLFGSFLVPIAGFFGINVEGAMTWLDWAGVLLFSGYVIFDLNRAMRVERTHDNAIDCALAIYLDFANLFIRLLQLLGQRKD